MKVKIFRESLTPLDNETNEQMMSEYKLNYDKLLELSAGDMQKMHISLDQMIEDLKDKYKDDLEGDVELPVSGKGWGKLLSTYGAITVGSHTETNKLCLVIMDGEARNAIE